MERLAAGGIEALMMPAPLSTAVAPLKGGGHKSKSSLMINTFTVNNFSALHLDGIDSSLNCSECEGQLVQNDHFP